MAALVAGFGAWAQGLPEVRLLFGQVCIINLFASMACVSAFRDLNTRTRVEWWRSLMVCGIWWYGEFCVLNPQHSRVSICCASGGGSTVGVIVSKVPGTQFAAVVVEKRCCLCSLPLQVSVAGPVVLVFPFEIMHISWQAHAAT